MRKSVVWLALSVSLLLADLGQALALEVSAARVRSYLDEPLVATIPVQVDNIQQRDSLAATLAPETEYVARGLQPLADPDDLVVQVVEGGNLEEMLIEVRSLSEVSEPFLGLVLQLTWDGGGQVQEFTLLLDPRPVMAEEEQPEEPASTGLAPVEPEWQEQPGAIAIEEDAKLRQLADDMMGSPGMTVSQGEQPDVVIRKVTPDEYLAGKRSGGEAVVVRSRPAAAALDDGPSYSGDSYGPVAAGETLWRIASKVRPANDVSMQQVMAAIHAANPQAFDGGYETLKKGAMLSIPSQDSMRAADPDQPVVVTRTTPSYSAELAEATAPETTGAADQPAQDEPAEELTEDSRPGIWNAPEPAEVDEAELDRKGGLITKQGAAPLAEESPAQAEASDEGGETRAEPAAADTEAPAASETAGAVDYGALEEGDLEAPELDPQAITDSEAEADLGMDAADMADSEAEAVNEALQSEEEATPVDESATPSDTGAAAAGNENTLKLAAAILLVLLLTYWWYRRRRRREEDEAPASYALPVTQEQSEQGDSQPAPPTFEDEQGGFGSDAASIDEEQGAPASEADAALEQADTYLSYGLYESAADTLQKGIDAEPNRSDLRMKLLETHEAAGDQDRFVAAVEAWQASDNPPHEAQRSDIEAMGQNAAPGVALFAAGAAAAGLVAASLQDDDQDQASTEDAPTTEPETPVTEDLPDPDFDLDTDNELDLPSEEAASDASQLEADSVALNLDLDEDLDSPLSEDKAEAPGDDELDLPDLDLDFDETPTADQQGEAQPEAPQADDSLNFDLDELELDTDTPAAEDSGLSLQDTGETEAAEGSEQEPATGGESEFDVKLDLAQAYVEMGEPDLAKGLLDEVMEGGNDSQRASAEKLLQEVNQG